MSTLFPKKSRAFFPSPFLEQIGCKTMPTRIKWTCKNIHSPQTICRILLFFRNYPSPTFTKFGKIFLFKLFRNNHLKVGSPPIHWGFSPPRGVEKLAFPQCSLHPVAATSCRKRTLVPEEAVPRLCAVAAWQLGAEKQARFHAPVQNAC